MLKIGDTVELRFEDSAYFSKLGYRFIGPFKVVQIDPADNREDGDLIYLEDSRGDRTPGIFAKRLVDANPRVVPYDDTNCVYEAHPRRFIKPINYEIPVVKVDDLKTKDTNPKDSVGTARWRIFTTIPMTVMAELGTAMREGALKYGRHNYRVAGVRASVYIDAAFGHIVQWWEGEDIDPDSNISHITKAIASLTVLRDAMIQDKLNDDRPPAGNIEFIRNHLQKITDSMILKYKDTAPAPFTQKDIDT